mmetsp:Transcript_62223/g.140176  ORF Transcript_62223/g.140176 Transcript_62223/m.140176 type:complete len:205 (+) Transcript_62223:74-688(+)
MCSEHRRSALLIQIRLHLEELGLLPVLEPRADQPVDVRRSQGEQQHHGATKASPQLRPLHVLPAHPGIQQLSQHTHHGKRQDVDPARRSDHAVERADLWMGFTLVRVVHEDGRNYQQSVVHHEHGSSRPRLIEVEGGALVMEVLLPALAANGDADDHGKRHNDGVPVCSFVRSEEHCPALRDEELQDREGRLGGAGKERSQDCS